VKKANLTISIDGSRAFVEGGTGTENYSLQLLKNIALVDKENSYLVYLRPGQKPGSGWPSNFRFKVIGLKRLWTQIGLSLATFVDNSDVLFVPSHTLPLIRRPGLKTVITVHDLGAEYLPFSHQIKQILYLKLMTHYQLSTATKVIAVSEATKKDLVKKIGLPGEKISVVHESVDQKVFKKIGNDPLRDIMSKYKITRGKYFLFVGTVQPRKNLERIISSFKDFISNSGQDINLVIAGSKGWKSKPLYSLPRELGIEAKVRFLGRVTDEDLVGLYNGATALVYPSLFEGFGLPILEANACGCPVITSDSSSMPEVVGDAGILVDAGSREQITEAMKKMYTNDPFRNRLIDKGYINLKRFSWEKTARETVKILIEAAKM
jgi:glycosyltransferase involved in cell wall biosynthesis